MENQEVQKKRFYKTWWFWTPVVVILLALMSSGTSSSAPVVIQPNVAPVATATPVEAHATQTALEHSQAPATPAQPATWHSVYSYSNSINTKTPQFSLKGSQQRITYSCSVLDSSDSQDSEFSGFIMAAGEYPGDGFAEYIKCPGSNTTYEYSLTPGQYHLELNPLNDSYVVTVEDYY